MKIEIKLNDTMSFSISTMLFTILIFFSIIFSGCETIANESANSNDRERFIFPLQSKSHYIINRFGSYKNLFTEAEDFHDGIDIRANVGTTVIASLDGVVFFIGEDKYYGKSIIITHNDDFKTLYGHLNSYNVKQGDIVSRGSKIAESGNTGYSTGPHLHFGIYKNKIPVNPLEYLY